METRYRMTRTQVLRLLKAQGTPQNRKVYARHGVKGPSFGVSYANLGKLTRRIKMDQALAESLWKTGNHDARVLATMIADPEAMTARKLDSWVRSIDNYLLADAFSSLASRTPSAQQRMEKWTKSRDEWVAACGWNILARLVSLENYPDRYLERFIRTIEDRIHRSRNRVRHSMNAALIAIGGWNERVRRKALSAARRIGTVEVDHGQTGCKTPDAAEYIQRMSARNQASRARG